MRLHTITQLVAGRNTNPNFCDICKQCNVHRKFYTSLRTADNPSNSINGINSSYFQGTWSVCRFYNPCSCCQRACIKFDITPRSQNDNFGFRYTGYISVPTNGIYTFYTSSDDGSKLYIGTTMVVNNDGLHGNQETSGQIGLLAGKHKVTVDFFEQAGSEILTVSYQGPGDFETNSTQFGIVYCNTNH